MAAEDDLAPGTRHTNARVRPRDAASLVVFHREGERLAFLMGVRASGHLFMPGHLVFPGGRLENDDVALAGHFPLPDAAADRLTKRTPAPFTKRRASALALAAIRETQEETGLMLGRGGHLPVPVPSWRGFIQARLVPTVEVLVPLARAITPPAFPRRFDARFFLVSSEHLAGGRTLPRPPTDEFETVTWVGSDELERYRVAPITLAVLDVAIRRVQARSERDLDAPIPFFRQIRQRQTTVLL